MFIAIQTRVRGPREAPCGGPVAADRGVPQPRPEQDGGLEALPGGRLHPYRIAAYPPPGPFLPLPELRSR